MTDDKLDIPDFTDETLPVLRPRHLIKKKKDGAPKMDVAGHTDVGLVREQNEDSFVIADLTRWLELKETSLSVSVSSRHVSGPKGTLLMVADGMGGHGGGEVASAVAVDMISQFALYAMPWVTDPDETEEKELLEKLGDAMTDCQKRLEKVALRKQLDLPGTTLTVAYVLWPKLYVAHAGDSRLYLLRENELTQITHDHTVGQALRDQGAIPQGPSRFDHILVNVVGGGGDDVRAEAHRLTLQPGDQLLLCSDGLTGHVADGLMKQFLSGPGAAREACLHLVEAAKRDGGYDNVTVVVAKF